MSQEQDKTSPAVPVTDGIHPEAAPFEPGYQPETLPQITVPDLDEDAQGLTAEALANVPTLTELVESESALADVPPQEASEVVEPKEPVATPLSDVAVPSPSSQEFEAHAQAQAVEADTWGEQLQVRMGKLTGDIHTLNARLDRLEERNKKKV